MPICNFPLSGDLMNHLWALLSPGRDVRPAAIGFVCCLAALSATLGCSEPEPITQYTIDTRVPPQLISQDRMLGAMVPHGDNVWFFKIVGPEKAIQTVAADVRKFVQAVRFRDGQPVLDHQPDAWRQAPVAGPMRFATIVIPTEHHQLELAVSSLSRSTPWDEQVTLNVNRWRGQLGLEESQTRWAGGESLDVAAADEEGAVWVDLTGDFGGGPSAAPMMGGPMAGGPMAAPFAQGGLADAAAAPAAASTASSPLAYETPEGWREGRSGGMRLAAFFAGADDAAEITVIAAGGDLRSNVARWLGQLHGEKVAEEVVDAAMADAQEVTVGQKSGQRFIMAGKGENPQAMDITVIPQDNGMSLFVKMTGPATVVRQQNEAMTEFLASLEP